MWGVERGQDLLKSIGFEEVSVERVPFSEAHVLYKAKKKGGI
jgi:hypothetical protein